MSVANSLKQRFLPLLPLAFVVFLSSTAFMGFAKAQDIVVVTYKDIELDNVSSADLGRLFLSLRSELGGVSVKAVNLSDEVLKYEFLEALTGMTERDVDAHFVKLDLRGEGDWPPEVASAEGLVKLLIKYQKAVGWMTTEAMASLSERSRSVLRIIAVDGLRPDDNGYVLTR